MKYKCLVAVFSVFSLCIYFFAFGDKKTEQISTGNSVSIDMHQNDTKTILVSQSFSALSSASVSESFTQVLTENQAYKVLLWNKAHGYFNDSDLAAYETYNIEGLKKLATEGDLMALELVARSYLKAGNMSEALNSFLQASAYGSTQALTAISFLMQSNYTETMTPEQKTQLSIDSLAFLEVAVMRGDVLSAKAEIEGYKRLRNFTPTLNQLELIAERASSIYQSIEDNRKSLGLPAFDNSVDEDVNTLAKMRKKYQ